MDEGTATSRARAKASSTGSQFLKNSYSGRTGERKTPDDGCHPELVAKRSANPAAFRDVGALSQRGGAQCAGRGAVTHVVAALRKTVILDHVVGKRNHRAACGKADPNRC